ncbi:LLM class flavin-dependent oxidoreductase [Amycolatopsis acidiphila]|uniref:LLM class flavin-dependent oxidoreductase n=1 Tax=Amycolatopsis acidiphila TaxID=715473 RepID=A0A558A4U2_9PSEU|nr:LLM class flavin-dependent oxidoreductase [Amycolatopsis acidiphila]TVT19282.1 LLM class flavin-dependent oxidoreductase [Amycolatopsis acidiphila]UIJ62290.1 LLM class flavin-dependent oxidoreductase [Amycolatopsis acidiphila]GHG96672.1 N5,N10-methylene tetrahydromethanopterin reductase [Amycolatopsis acidiphila]
MSDRIFRFGLVAASRGTVGEWAALARRAEELGFSTLLVPDGVRANPSFLGLAAAASVTERLRLGNFVLPVPLYTPQSIAWEAAALDRLSEGRFELGLGAGRPDAAGDAELMEVPYGSPGERVRQVGEAIETADRMFAQEAFRPAQTPRPPIMVAGGGDKLLTIAARQADIVAVAADGSERGLGEKLRLVREVAGDRFDELELSVNVFHIGDGEVSPWVRMFGIDPERTADNQNVSVLTGDTATAIDTLKRRRDELGVSYVTINVMALEQAIPVVAALAGT